jgi:hypothetical protein
MSETDWGCLARNDVYAALDAQFLVSENQCLLRFKIEEAEGKAIGLYVMMDFPIFQRLHAQMAQSVETAPRLVETPTRN